MLRKCPGYTATGDSGHIYAQPPHDLENTPDNFAPHKNQCRDCYREYAADWRARRNVGGGSSRPRVSGRRPSVIVMPDLRAPALEDGEFVSDEDLEAGSHKYIPSPELLETWAAVTTSARDGGGHPFNLLFLGPSGSGKTEAAKYLASLVGIGYTKVDAASMVDAESWFGTREVVESESGASITAYKPSSFVLAIEEPGVLLIDEINRIGDQHRNILLPLLDGTHQVTNPLTGEVVVKDPKCFVIMSGNRGLNFTGTFAVDPALMTRSLVLDFDYPSQVDEVNIALESSGCDQDTAELFVRFAAESRIRAKNDPDFNPISTREVMAACRLVKKGATPDLAARLVVLNAASPEGGPSSIRAGLQTIWAGIRANPSGPAVRACGVAHPYLRADDGGPATCAVEVRVVDPTHEGQEHKFVRNDGQEITWS